MKKNRRALHAAASERKRRLDTPSNKLPSARRQPKDRLPCWPLRIRDALDSLRMARVRLCEAEVLVGDSAALLWINECFTDLDEAEDALLGSSR